MPYLTTPAVAKRLKTFCKKYPTAAKAAAALKVTPPQLSRTLGGHTNVIPGRILKKLGLQAVTVYAPIGKTALKSVKVSRDATTGRTVSKAQAKANPKGTITETQQRAVKPKAKNVSAKPKRRSSGLELPCAPGDEERLVEARRLAAVHTVPDHTVPDHTVIDITAKS